MRSSHKAAIRGIMMLMLAQVVIVVHAAAICTQQEFQCNSSKCIPRHLKCNGQNDCDDSSDEINCTNRDTCDEDEFACIDGICIPSSLVCNGRMDCPRGLDEMNCATPSPSIATPSINQGFLRTADGQTTSPFPLFPVSPSFRIYLRFTARQCSGHLLELTSQNTDQFFLLSLNKLGGVDLFFKTSLGFGLINLPGRSFCNGKMFLLTLKRDEDKVFFRINRSKRFVTRHKFLKVPFPWMNKVNVGFGIVGCVSGIDMIYYNSAKMSHSVGFSKGCVLKEKITQAPTASLSSMKLGRVSTNIIATRNRVWKSGVHAKMNGEPPSVTHSTITGKNVIQPVTHSVTKKSTDSVTHIITEEDTQAVLKTVTQPITNDVMQNSTKPESVTRYDKVTQLIPVVVTQSSKHGESRCRQLPLICAGAALRKTYRMDKSTNAAEKQIQSFLPFIRANCSPFLQTFLCVVFFSSCSISQSTTNKPCRELCLKTKDQCRTLMDAFEFKWPDTLNCEHFPSIGSQQCYLPQLLRATPIQLTTPTLSSTRQTAAGKAKPTKRKRCGGILTNRAGQISSPNYPHPYPPNTQCQWTIVLPRIYRVINIMIEDASLEADNNCGYDYLVFRDGLSNQVGSKICGFLEYPRRVTIKGHIAVVMFKSDSAVNKKGFFIKYEAYWR